MNAKAAMSNTALTLDMNTVTTSRALAENSLFTGGKEWMG